MRGTDDNPYKLPYLRGGMTNERHMEIAKKILVDYVTRLRFAEGGVKFTEEEMNALINSKEGDVAPYFHGLIDGLRFMEQAILKGSDEAMRHLIFDIPVKHFAYDLNSHLPDPAPIEETQQ